MPQLINLLKQILLKLVIHKSHPPKKHIGLLCAMIRIFSALQISFQLLNLPRTYENY